MSVDPGRVAGVGAGLPAHCPDSPPRGPTGGWSPLPRERRRTPATLTHSPSRRASARRQGRAGPQPRWRGGTGGGGHATLASRKAPHVSPQPGRHQDPDARHPLRSRGLDYDSERTWKPSRTPGGLVEPGPPLLRPDLQLSCPYVPSSLHLHFSKVPRGDWRRPIRCPFLQMGKLRPSPGVGGKVTQRVRHSAAPGSRALPITLPELSPVQSSPAVSPPAPPGREAARLRPRPGTLTGSQRKRTGCGRRRYRAGPRVAAATSAGHGASRANGSRSALPAWCAGQVGSSWEAKSAVLAKKTTAKVTRTYKVWASRSGALAPLLVRQASRPRPAPPRPAPSRAVGGRPLPASMGKAAGLAGRRGVNYLELHQTQSFEGRTRPCKRRPVPFCEGRADRQRPGEMVALRVSQRKVEKIGEAGLE